MEPTKSELASYLDHTLLKQDATAEAVDRVVGEAREIGAASVCVNPYWVSRVSEGLAGSGVRTCTVVGFPLGATTTASKVAETAEALANGADEVDMVINVGELKEGNDAAGHADIDAVAGTVHEAGKLLKVILETCLLTDDEIRRASGLAAAAGTDFVKTSTGFSIGGAKAHDVAIMREAVGPDLGVKASGGIHSYEEAVEMLEAGADRLGVSASLAILAGAPDDVA